MSTRRVVLVLLIAVLGSSCAQTADEDASYESQEDLIAALDDGGFPCGRVDVRVRDREGQVLVDSSPDVEESTADEKKRSDARMVDNEQSLRARGYAGWATCWWDGGRLDAFTHETEQDRLLALVTGLEFGCVPGPGLEHPAYVQGTDWVVSSGDFATGIDVMGEVAASIGGRANEARCVDLELFLDGVEADGRALADLSVAELKAGLGEE